MDYHYKLVGFGPRTDIEMGQWGFCIQLDFRYAQLLVSRPMLPDRFQRLNEMAAKVQAGVFADKDPSNRRRPTFGFWEDTCLLTNITVEPGNACGLDMEWGRFEMVKRGSNSPYAKVDYLPHNIDSVQQAAALLAVWTLWYDHSESLMTL